MSWEALCAEYAKPTSDLAGAVDVVMRKLDESAGPDAGPCVDPEEGGGRAQQTVCGCDGKRAEEQIGSGKDGEELPQGAPKHRDSWREGGLRVMLHLQGG